MSNKLLSINLDCNFIANDKWKYVTKKHALHLSIYICMLVNVLKRPCKKTLCLFICIFVALQLCCFQNDVNTRQVPFSMCSGVWVVLHVSLGPEHGAQVDLVSFTAIWRREHGRRPCIIQQLKACLGLYSITKSMTFM